MPNYKNLKIEDYDWQTNTHGKIEEIIPLDIPPPLGNTIRLMTYVDANLFYNIITGRSVTGILHLINKLHLIGTVRSRQQSKQQRMVANSRQLGLRRIKLSQIKTSYAILESQSNINPIYLETINWSLTVQ